MQREGSLRVDVLSLLNEITGMISPNDFEIPVTAGRIGDKKIAIHYGFDVDETTFEEIINNVAET